MVLGPPDQGMLIIVFSITSCPPWPDGRAIIQLIGAAFDGLMNIIIEQ